MDKTKQLRSFGLVVGGVFAGIALFLLIRSDWTSTAGRILGAIATPLILLGLVYPRALGPVEKVWMKIAHVLGWINTRLILGILFFTVVTLTRVFLLVTRKDPMDRKLNPALATYWNDLPTDFDPKSYEDPF